MLKFRAKEKSIEPTPGIFGENILATIFSGIRLANLISCCHAEAVAMALLEISETREVNHTTEMALLGIPETREVNHTTAMALLEIPEIRIVHHTSGMALVHWCRFLKRQIFNHATAVALSEISEVLQNNHVMTMALMQVPETSQCYHEC
jgi:hypothetical protein